MNHAFKRAAILAVTALLFRKVDITMKVAALQESVTVSGEVPLVETARSEPTSVVLADQILVAGQPTGLLEIPVEWMRDDAIVTTPGRIPTARTPCSRSGAPSSTRRTKSTVSFRLRCIRALQAIARVW